MITEDIESGRPVSAQFPLSAAWKNGEENQRTSLCALSKQVSRRPHIRASASYKANRYQYAPECRALDNDFDRPGKLGVLGERLVDVDGLPRVADADFGHRILSIHPLEKPRR